MNHFLAGDDRHRDLIYDDDYRSYLVSRSQSPDGYRFGRTPRNSVGATARAALRRANLSLKRMIEAVANAKLRRMERELELRGIRFDRKSKPAERS
jgi:hypothetical protein